MKTKCYKGGNHHKFEPRYTEKCASFKLGPGTEISSHTLLKLTKPRKIYVYDVCVWCGKTTENKKPS